MYEDDNQKEKSVVPLLIMILYFVAWCVVVAYLFWAGYTERRGFSVLAWGTLYFLFSKRIATYFSNVIELGQYLNENENWKDFGILHLIISIEAFIKACIFYTAGFLVSFLYSAITG